MQRVKLQDDETRTWIPFSTYKEGGSGQSEEHKNSEDAAVIDTFPTVPSDNSLDKAYRELSLEIMRREEMLKRIIQKAKKCKDLDNVPKATIFWESEGSPKEKMVDASKLANICLEYDAPFYELVGRMITEKFWEELEKTFDVQNIREFRFNG